MKNIYVELRFGKNEQTAKYEYINRQVKEIMATFVAAGATFYKYRGHPIMHLNGWLTDLLSSADALTALDEHLNVNRLPYLREIAKRLWLHARDLCVTIPEELIELHVGPDHRSVTMRMISNKARNWLREAIESGILQ